MWIVRIGGILIALFGAWVWIALAHMDDASPPSNRALALEALPVIGVALLSQAGLFLAPVVRNRSWKYRLGVAMLMAPTLMLTLNWAWGNLHEVAAYAASWLLHIGSLWLPVLALYTWQLLSLVRPNPERQPSVKAA